MSEIDLDTLARGYRHRPPSAAALARADQEAAAAELGAGGVALDIGGGRGEHAGRFAASGAAAIVVDRSAVAAGIAASLDGVDAVVGDSARLPIRDRCVDLAYFHASIHYGDWCRALHEAARVLVPGGSLAVWTFSQAHFGSSFLARWFPSIAAIDRSRFPAPAELAAHLESLNFGSVAITDEVEIVRRSAGSWLEAAAGRFVSTLQMLPPGELEAGLDRFRAAHPDPAEMIEYPLDYRRIGGFSP